MAEMENRMNGNGNDREEALQWTHVSQVSRLSQIDGRGQISGNYWLILSKIAQFLKLFNQKISTVLALSGIPTC